MRDDQRPCRSPWHRTLSSRVPRPMLLVAALALVATMAPAVAPDFALAPMDALGGSAGLPLVTPLRSHAATPLAAPSCTAGENLLPNAGFESGTDAWFIRGNIAPTSDEVHEGAMAMRLVAGDDDAYLDHRIAPVEPGATYVLSAWGKVSASGETGEIGVQLYDGDGERLTTLEPAPLSFTSTSFSEESLTFTAPDKSAEAYVYLVKDEGAALFYADALSLTVCEPQASSLATPAATPVPATPAPSEVEGTTATPVVLVVEATPAAPHATPASATGETPTADRSGCDPAYPEARTCIPPGPPFDQGCAITAERNFVVLPPDPQRLDRDQDGIGCEPIRHWGP